MALRIFLTIPVTAASAERIFSKSKIIKNYLRSTISQNRLVGLATISIEHEIVDDIHYKSFTLVQIKKKTKILSSIYLKGKLLDHRDGKISSVYVYKSLGQALMLLQSKNKFKYHVMLIFSVYCEETVQRRHFVTYINNIRFKPSHLFY